MMKNVKFNWAVFNTETGFRLTEYGTRTKAIRLKGMILRDLPNLKSKIEIKQRNYEKSK